MANYRKRYSSLTKSWTPVAVVGKSITTRKLAERIEKESTASLSDIMSVLYSLPHIIRDELSNGNSVKLDGIGSFSLSVQCHKTGVANAEDVDPYTQITSMKVLFVPEKESYMQNGKRKMRNSLVADDITWIELQERKGTKSAGGTTPSGGGTTPTPDPDPDQGGGGGGTTPPDQGDND